MDTRDTATAVDRAIALPEIVALIASYLDRADTLACSAVSRILRESFTPYVWQDRRFGPPLVYDTDASLSRCIDTRHLPDIVSDIAEQNGIESRKQIMATFRDIAPWIRTLAILSHKSIFPLQLGVACSRIQSLTILGVSSRDADCNTTPAHWTNCKMMMRRNRDHLRSLSLFSWNYDNSRPPQPGQPDWNPILACTKSWNLRSLSLEHCSIRGRHMAAFWIVCSRLESLSMANVDLHLDLSHSSHAKRSKCTIANNDHSEVPPSNKSTARFPRLKALKLYEMPTIHVVCQLDLLISQCPVLRTLDWIIHDQRFSVKPFTDRLKSSTWPELDSITIVGTSAELSDVEYRDILLATQQSVRRWVAQADQMTLETFDVYRTRHFSTLETIDITYSLGDTSQWTIEILTSCPNLLILRAPVLHAKDILKTNKPWVCHGLQEMTVFFDMGFQDRGPYRRFTEEELDNCRAVFKRLATLKELQVLDMLRTYPHFVSDEYTVYGHKPPLEDHLVPLPLRLKAGLGLLKGLRKLKMVGFWSGRHEMPMKELNWMVQHWKRLDRLNGGWIFWSVPVGGLLDARIWSEEQTKWLREHMIQTNGSQYLLYRDQERELGDYDDWCGLSDEEDESVGSSS